MVSFSAIFIKLYPEKVLTITSWSQTALGVGYSIGPALGGFLYDIGGFHLPFIFIGVSNIIFAIITLLALSKEECISTGAKNGGESSMRIILKVPGKPYEDKLISLHYDLPQNPALIIPYFDNVVCCMGFSMVESTYAHYLDIIHAPPFIARTTFILMGIFNIVGKLIMGNILDLSDKAPVIFCLIGNVLMIVPYMALGIMPYQQTEENYQQWVIMASSPMLTSGFVLVFISTFFRMYHVKLTGLQGEDTSTLISGL